jgi:hypothetical protein
MIDYGRKHCDGDNANLHEGSPWYYDGEKVYYQIADYTNDETWNACAQKYENVYAPYVVANNGGIPFWRVFPHGLEMGFRRSGSAQALQALTFLNAVPYGSSNIVHTISWKASREISYAVEAQFVAQSLSMPEGDYLYQHVESLIGMYDQWFISNTAQYAQPYMVGLAAEAMIKYYEVSQDPRVPWLLKIAADAMWERSWDPLSGSFFYYNEVNSFGPAPDLNLLIAPLYGWLFRQTGDATYRDRGDQIFESGVRKAWLGGGKQFSQNYRWSFSYIAWRNTTAQVSENRCDIDTDGTVNVVDVQLGINQAMGINPCISADIDLNGSCNVVDVQLLINAAMGQSCGPSASVLSQK